MLKFTKLVMIKDNKHEEGFVLVIALMLLLVTTLMGTMLVINATSQSKVTSEYATKQQTFLSGETGMQASIKYLADLVSNNNYPDNTNLTFDTICNYPLAGFYKAADLPFNYAYKTPNPVPLSTAMNLTGDVATKYAIEKYEYYLSVLGASSSSGIGAGSSVGAGSEYSGAGSTTTIEYRIISCGTNDNTNSRSILETIVEVN